MNESTRRSARLAESASLNRVSDPYGEYYQVAEDRLLGSLEPQFLEDRVDFAHFTLRRLGFISVWDLVLAIGRGHESSSIEAEMEQFFASTCASELVNLLVPFLSSDIICNISKSLYLLEWEHVRSLGVLTQDFDSSDLSSFDFGDIYMSMQQSGPNLIDLFDHLSNKAMITHANERACQRYVVMSLSQFVHRNNPRANFIQTMIGLHLYASNVPKRLYLCLNHLGFSVSDQTLRRQLTIAAISLERNS